jgi:hypothetical protein
MLAHIGHNIAVAFVGGSAEAGTATAALYLAAAIVVVIATDRRTLTRRSRTEDALHAEPEGSA